MHERPTVFFHIGGHKTGTTYLQNVLRRNRAALRRDGMLFPGDRPASHVWASHDLRGAAFKDYRNPHVTGAWGRLVDEIRHWNGPAIIDHEMFSLARSQHVARALRDLDFADVHVVFTARDMARQLPAAWQEWIKNRDTLSFAQFLAAVRKPSDESRRFLSLHDVPAILARWARVVPAASIHVITVPPPGADPGLLWQRFCAVLGLDPERYDTSVTRANTSLGAAEAAVLRRLNLELADQPIPWPAYGAQVKHGLAPELSKRPGARISLPPDAYAWALAWANQAVADLAAAGYDVTGDLAELIPSARPSGLDPDDVDAEAQAAAAIAGMAALLRLPAARSTRPRRARRGRPAGTDRALPDVAATARAKQRAVELAGRVRWLGALLSGYRRLRHHRQHRRRR